MPTDPESRARRVLALIAHDGKKADIVAFASYNREKLATYTSSPPPPPASSSPPKLA